MSEQEPEEIWAVTEPNDVSADILGDVYAQQTPDGMVGKPVKYIRADLAKPRVKQLQWITPSPTTDGKWQDTTGIYDIEESILFIGHVETGTPYITDKEAKAAAQADYERRVLSALILPGDG